MKWALTDNTDKRLFILGWGLKGALTDNTDSADYADLIIYLIKNVINALDD